MDGPAWLVSSGSSQSGVPHLEPAHRERDEDKEREEVGGEIEREKRRARQGQRQRRRDGRGGEDGDREIREPGTGEEPAINEFPGEKEGHGEITEQKKKTEMTFLKGLLCGICRKKNEM